MERTLLTTVNPVNTARKPDTQAMKLEASSANIINGKYWNTFHFECSKVLNLNLMCERSKSAVASSTSAAWGICAKSNLSIHTRLHCMSALSLECWGMLNHMVNPRELLKYLWLLLNIQMRKSLPLSSRSLERNEAWWIRLPKAASARAAKPCQQQGDSNPQAAVVMLLKSLSMGVCTQESAWTACIALSHSCW